MAKRTVSFADYQEPTWEEYTGEDPPANKWFTGTVKSAKYKADDDQVMFVIEISDTDSPYKGWGRAWYANFDGDLKWKMHEILRAIQGGKTNDVTVDWENEKAVDAWLKKAKPIKFQTQFYNDKMGIRKVRPMLELAGTAPVAKASATLPSASEPEPDVIDEGDVEDYTEEELSILTDDELLAILAEEFEVDKDDPDLPKKSRRDRTGTKYHADLVAFVLDVQDGDDEDGDEPDDDTDPEGDEFDDGFDDGEGDDPEPEPEPEPAPRARRSRAVAPAKAAPAKAAAPAATGRRRRG